MKWHLATNQQLDTIFNSDTDCPNYLLLGLVEEMMKRTMFDGMIIRIANSIMSYFERDEVLQLANIGIYQMAKNFHYSGLTFKQLVYITIERRLKSYITHQNTIRNKMNRHALVNEVPVMESLSNVEEFVIQKMMLQEQLDKLTSKERYIINQFIKGYSLNHMALHTFHKDPKYVHYHFNKALAKMKIDDYKIGARAGVKGA